mmetsp:Transcript_28206/g.79637  ORF Transcript_28206/g.79637 Transcript_28206/m.79637 type:complete len:214 (+) Transcript_28206:639-1280(+)
MRGTQGCNSILRQHLSCGFPFLPSSMPGRAWLQPGLYLAVCQNAAEVPAQGVATHAAGSTFPPAWKCKGLLSQACVGSNLATSQLSGSLFQHQKPSLFSPHRSLASQTPPEGNGSNQESEKHDPVRTRIIHFMVLGTFLVAGSNVLPHIGVTSVENSAKLLGSKDALMQKAGADRLCYLASFSSDRRKEMIAGPVLVQLTMKVNQETKPGQQG